MDNLRVEIDGGLIEGEILTNELNKEPYYSFKGVPYARPPVGPLRFQPPERVESWNGVLKCTEERDICIQQDVMGILGEPYAGSEDCLYLNIYSPVKNSNKSLRPVMVFIHGGGFQFGSKDSKLHGPDFLIAKGVVLVLMNYRLNIFGFLNLGIEECRGNVGLLDQRAALVWVKKHIQNFSGDPENITLFGESAGSVSVHYHLLSPLSRGLYHKAILQSGSCADPWAVMDLTLCIDRAFRVGKQLGCTTTDVKELYKFLLDVPARALAEATSLFLAPEECGGGLSLPFVPSKEIVGASEDRFLTDDPKTLLKNCAEVPVLSGTNSAEGLLFFLEGPQKLSALLENTELAFDKMFPKDLNRLSTDQAKIETAKSKIRQFYMKDSSSDSVVANNFANFYGDLMFGRGYHRLLKTYLSSPMREPFYSYLYDFESQTSLIRAPGNLPDYLKGACHADEMRLLFPLEPLKKTVFESEACMRVVGHMTTIWTNFAKFGNPDPNGELKIDWEPVTPNKVSYCKIDEKLEIQPGFVHEERMKLWDELYQSMSN